ncbi:hypothetical protein [Eisenbergiella sp.]
MKLLSMLSDVIFQVIIFLSFPSSGGSSRPAERRASFHGLG